MSRHLFFSVFDKQANSFSAPFLERSKETASRAFHDAMVSGEHELFSKWPADFSLFILATFDDETGAITPLDRDLIITGEDIMRRVGSLPSAEDSSNG